MKPGRFISVEGIEGAGKSSCIHYVQERLMAKGVSVRLTREPGGTSLGEALRSLLLDHNYQGMAADTELLMMFAARAEHLAQVIRPALAAGDWVISDRFTDATYAYQGAGRALTPERIGSIETWVQQGLAPDLTLLLDLPVELGLERAGKRSSPDRFEVESLAFFERVRRAYLDLAAAHPDRIQIIDASQDIPAVQRQLAQALTPLLSGELY